MSGSLPNVVTENGMCRILEEYMSASQTAVFMQCSITSNVTALKTAVDTGSFGYNNSTHPYRDPETVPEQTKEGWDWGA